MPELPEVETVCRGLRKQLIGRKIQHVIYRRKNIRFVLPQKMPQFVQGKKIISVSRLSKYALLDLEDGARILIHLGMSGRLSFSTIKKYTEQKHDHVTFHFDKDLCLTYNDARRFGVVDYIPPHKNHRLLESLGQDPFAESVTKEWFFDTTRTKKVNLKTLLMDQRFIAGLGNIYVSEALFDAKLWPERVANTLSLKECGQAIRSIRKVLLAAIEAGGSSLRDYVQTDGEIGFFQDQFKVYGREDKKCPRCRTESILRMVHSGRATFACAGCQV
jgi:formamidopyrimidine-DNA glycosylase